VIAVSHGNLSNAEGFYFCPCRKEVPQLFSLSSEPGHLMNHKLIPYCYLTVVVMMKTSEVLSQLGRQRVV